jgi:hypothetical protein
MSNPSDDPFQPRPEQPAEGPVTPGQAPPPVPGEPAGYAQQPYGEQPYGQPPAPGYGAPPPAYGQPAAAPPYPGAGQYPPAPAAGQYPPAPGYGSYPAAPYASYGTPYPKNNYGVISIVLAIASFFTLGFIVAIPAVILGNMGRRAADEGQANNRSLSTAGIIIGWVNIVLCALAVVGLIVFVIVAASNHTVVNG